jgi:predicted RNA binding protein YcfA (HicA-like mRNA interferase family)
MTRVPKGVSGQQCVRALQRAGFVVDRQRGSHIVMYRSDPLARVIVPNHKEIKPGTLRQIINDAGLTIDEFLSLL